MRLVRVVGEPLTLSIGDEKVHQGCRRAGALVVILVMLSGTVDGKLRGVFDAILDLACVVEPVGRICDLLDSEPKIEPRFEGHFVAVRDTEQLAAVMSTLSDSGQTVEALSIAFDEGVEVPPERTFCGFVSAWGCHSSGQAQVSYDVFRWVSWPLFPATTTGRFDLEEVEFQYPSDTKKLVLSGVTLSVEPSQHVALVGHAGCGKSSIFQIGPAPLRPMR
mmetsp:Transcript_46324/g.123029  ORF Transcript_46324/g.123029 Transcript_46324/m.123029 type:complete len:220 (-) Transcript_46324:58-717(-)